MNDKQFTEKTEEKSLDKQEQIFWLDKWEGIAQGGFFVRNDLKDFVDKLTAKGLKIVGIKFDGTYNLDVIVDKAGADKYLNYVKPEGK